MEGITKPYEAKAIKLFFNCYVKNSSSKQKWRIISIAVNRLLRDKKPKEIAISITPQCQFDCVHCCMAFSERKSGSELSLGEIKGIINDVSREFSMVSFTGKEPLLRKKDLMVLVRYASSKGLFPSIDTNASCLDYDTAKKLKEARLSHVFISLDSPTEKEHDNLRKFKGSYNAVMEAMDNCKKAGLPFLLSTYVSKKRLTDGSLEEIIKIAREKGAAGVRVLEPKLAGRLMNRKDMILDGKDKALFQKLLSSGFVFNECKENIIADPLCPTGSNRYVYISHYGEVQPCPLVPVSFGNIRERRVMDIIDCMWKHEMFRDFSERTCLINNSRFRKRYLKGVSRKTKLPIYAESAQENKK